MAKFNTPFVLSSLLQICKYNIHQLLNFRHECICSTLVQSPIPRLFTFKRIDHNNKKIPNLSLCPRESRETDALWSIQSGSRRTEGTQSIPALQTGQLGQQLDLYYPLSCTVFAEEYCLWRVLQAPCIYMLFKTLQPGFAKSYSLKSHEHVCFPASCHDLLGCKMYMLRS